MNNVLCITIVVAEHLLTSKSIVSLKHFNVPAGKVMS